jgi:hypothetical protein
MMRPDSIPVHKRPLSRGDSIEEVRAAQLLKCRGVFRGFEQESGRLYSSPAPSTHPCFPQATLRVLAATFPLSPKRSGQAEGIILHLN